MMRKMGQPYPSDPFGLEKASTSAERSYFDLKNRTERKIIAKFSSMCDYIAMTGMVINAIMLKAFERHRIRVRSLIEYRRGIYIMMTRAMAFTHSTNSTTDDQQNANFSASKEPMQFGLDNCATHHICTNKALFSEIKIPEREIGVQGVAGSLAAEGIGTIAFNITDDNGKLHAIVLQNVILLPSAPKNLISVSRWSKDACDDCTITSGGEYSVFRWGNERFKKTVHHPPECSIPLMQVNEDKGDKALLMFTREHRLQFIAEDANEAQRQPNDNVLQGNIVSDKQSPATNPCDASSELRAGDTVHISRNGKRILATVKKVIRVGNGSLRYRVSLIDDPHEFTIQSSSIEYFTPDPADIPHSPKDVELTSIANILTAQDLTRLWSPTSDDTVSKESRLALYWHHRFRCAPLRHLHRLAERGVIPRCITRVKRMPLCASCAFAAAHRRNWRSKGEQPRHIRKHWQKEPGNGTSCDHIVSHQPGLIPQSTGKLTHERFWGSVLYVDHATDYLFNHFIRGTTSEETLESKLAYERHALSHGVKIGAYHADNSRFNDSRFLGSCRDAGQQLTFCGVGAHHQNALAERKIKEVCYGGRTVLLHAKRRWPNVISTILWPFALQSVVDRHNRLSLDDKGRSPLEKFARTDEEIRPEEFHTWGCPVFVLAAQNQSEAKALTFPCRQRRFGAKFANGAGKPSVPCRF